MKHYNNDAYQTEARFKSVCAGCGAEIKKGDNVYIFPSNAKGKKAFCSCAEKDFNFAQSEIMSDRYGCSY